MTTGLPVTATIVEVRGTSRSEYAQLRDDAVPVLMKGRLPDGKPWEVRADLPPGPGYAKVGAEVDVRVDPNDPNVWVEQGEVLPWWRVVAVPMLLLMPISLLLLAIAIWRRMMILRVWRDGVRGHGVVTDVRQDPVAPRSRIVRYSLIEGRDKRVFRILYPVREGVPRVGDLLNLIVNPDRPQDSLVAELYLSPPTQ